MHVRGASSRTLTGEIGLSEIQNVFAEVFICPETMKLHQKSLRETHFEATVTRFEISSEIRRKSRGSRLAAYRNPAANLFAQGRRFLLSAAVRLRLAVDRDPPVPARSMKIDVHTDSCSALLLCQNLKRALLSHRFVPKA